MNIMDLKGRVHVKKGAVKPSFMEILSCVYLNLYVKCLAFYLLGTSPLESQKVTSAAPTSICRGKHKMVLQLNYSTLHN